MARDFGDSIVDALGLVGLGSGNALDIIRRVP
jgi:hypothetical protein